MPGRTLIALLVPIAVSLVVGRVFSRPPVSLRAQAQFKTFCASCHDLVGDGQPRIGPPLDNIGELAASRRPNMGAAEYVLESIVDPSAFRAPGVAGQMPGGIWRSLSADELRELVRYVVSHGGSVSDAELEALQLPDPEAEETRTSREFDLDLIAQGETLFLGKGKCVTCHGLRPDPGFDLRAPSLLDSGESSAEFLRESILEPTKSIVAGYEEVVVPLKNKTSVSGRLVGASKEQVELLTVAEDGKFERLVIPLTEVARPLSELHRTTAMPPIRDVLSEAEVEAVIAFLQTLRSGYAGKFPSRFVLYH